MHYMMLFNHPLKRWRAAGDNCPLSGAMSEYPCTKENHNQTAGFTLPINNNSDTLSTGNAILQAVYERVYIV
jgi:hypothetical protein